LNASGEPGRDEPRWFEDESFWTAYAPLMFDEDRWAEVPAVVDAIEALAKPRPGAAVLDACCGPGRHSLELASRGYRVTGIDITESYLAAARESAEAWELPPDGAVFLRSDIRSFEASEPFDLALNLYTSFGYFPDREDDRAALARLHAALRDGGELIIETTGKETAVRDFTEGESFERAGWNVRTEFSVVGHWEALRNRWIMSRGGEVVDRSFDIRLYSATELEAELLAAGFSRVRVMGGLDGSPYGRSAASLVCLATV
jgi:SAM-dependent methyltransferase